MDEYTLERYEEKQNESRNPTVGRLDENQITFQGEVNNFYYSERYFEKSTGKSDYYYY